MPLLTTGRRPVDPRQVIAQVREPTPEQARVALAALRLTLGAGWLTPNAVAKGFGVDPQRQETLAYVGRLFAARDAMMGVALLATDGDERDRWLQWGIAVNVADAVAAVLAGLRQRLSWKATLSAAGLASLAAYLGVVARRGQPRS